MRKVERVEIQKYQDYEKNRDVIRQKLMLIKNDRRIHLGQHLTFLFENHDTVLYQIQEMMRTEKIEGEKEINHELLTYNELIGDKGSLGCTLLIEIEDKDLRTELLSKWINLPQSIYLKTNQNKKVFAQFDERQMSPERISSVHYLKFDVGDQIPTRMGCSHPELNLEVELNPNQINALCADLIRQ